MVNTLTVKCLEIIYNNKCKITHKKFVLFIFFLYLCIAFLWEKAFNEV